jgi:hypothetical protein
MKKLLLVSLVFALLFACGGGEKTAQPAPAAGQKPSPPPQSDTGTISGTVSLLGTPPPMPLIQMTGDTSCSTGHAAMKSEEVVTDAAGNLQNVFVYIKPEDVKDSYPPSTTPALLDQNGCHYTPHVLGVQVGQKLDIRNSDSTLHNVRAMAKVNEEFNIGQPVPMTSEKVFDKPEIMVKFRCDVHGWMNAWVGVVPHPFFAVSGPEGSFSIPDLPPGTYTVEAWHEKYGTTSQQVTVGPKESKRISITFKAG